MEAEIWELRVTLEGYTFLGDKALLNERRRGSRHWRARREFLARAVRSRRPFEIYCWRGRVFPEFGASTRSGTRGYEGIFAGHFQIAVAGDLRRFDGASDDLLTARDISSPKGVWSQAREVSPLRFGCLM